MGTLYESIKSLCDEKGIKPGKMCVETGISKGLITDLKMGRKKSIQVETAQKIADYFGVSVDRVLGTKQKKEPDDSKVIRQSEIDSIFSQLTPSRQSKLLELARLYLGDQRKSGENQ